MKKLLFFFILSIELVAFDSVTASKIFDKIFHALVLTEEITVYTVNPDYQKVIMDAPDLYLCTLAKRSDIVLVSSMDEIPKDVDDKILFATSYFVYQENENVVGVFYWDRGHIKIEFSLKRLRAKKIILPRSFYKYLNDDI